MPHHPSGPCLRIGSVLAVLLLVVPVASDSVGGPPAELESRYPERLTYDLQKQEWVPDRAPEPGTADGDLALVRSALARSEEKQAAKQLDEWMETYSDDSARLPEAVFLRGRADFELGNWMRAHRRYQEVLNRWPGSEWAEQALRGEFIIAEGFLSGRKRKFLGVRMFKAHEEALDILDDIMLNHPSSALAERAHRVKAEFYFRRGEFELAEDAYAQLARDYPAGEHVRDAMLQSAHAALAGFPGVQFDDSSLIEAEERFLEFRRAFPHHAEGEQIGVILDSIQGKRAEKDFRIGEYYERVGRLQAAVHYYRLVSRGWPDTTWASRSRARLAFVGVSPE